MKQTRLLALLLAALLLALPACGRAAPAATETPAAEPAEPAVPTAEDFAGAYACTHMIVNGQMQEADPETLRVDQLPTMTVADGFATFTGLTEMGTDPVPLDYADGALCFIPEPSTTVFTLNLLDDGMVTMTFNMIPNAPVFCFSPA